MKKLVVLILFFTCNIAFCQKISKTTTGLKTTIGGINIEVQFYSASIVRIIKSPEENQYKKTSISVIKKPEHIHVAISQNENTVKLKSDSLVVALNLQTGKLSFANTNAHVLLKEKENGTQFTAIKDVEKPTYTVKQSFMLDKDEVIYGLGQQQNGKMNQRGQKVYLRQENMKVCIPFFQSVKGYGLFWDNYSPTTFTDNEQETSFNSKVGDCSDYYFLLGGSGDGVIAQMRNLTGQAPLMPLWVYGFNQSRERYKTQYELVDVVKKYRSLNVPLDGVIQDWQYWGRDSNWNAMSFEPSTFSNPQSMIDSVHLLNAHFFIVAWPGFGPLTKQYAELKAKNMIMDFETWPPQSGTRPYDVYNPEARNIYWRYLNKGIFSLGSDAWWLDSSEPDHVNLKEKDFDLPTYLGTFRSVRNAFPIEHVSGVYDHQRATTSQKRVSILTRSAFAGQQRYGANTWSGDVRSEWEVLRKQIPAGLNFSLSGIPYWNTDIGGFFADAFVKDGGAKNPAFQELYIRWMQFATFTPMMRSHGTNIPREIYQFGNRGEAAFDIQEKFINLRYSLLLYIYSTAWNVTAHAGSFMRALYMYFPNDKQVLDIDNEYMFGKSILVNPVTEKGVKSQQLYLPGGTTWYNFWTGDVFNGGEKIECAAPLDILPLYVKAGSIIPWGPKVQYAEEKKWNDLELRIYPGANAEFVLYEDENNNYNYEKGNYSEIVFHWNDKNKILTVDNIKGHFPGMLTNRKFKIVVVNKNAGIGEKPTEKPNKIISYNGKKVAMQL